MSDLACPHKKDFRVREVAATEPRAKAESHSRRFGRTRSLLLCASVLIFIGTLLHSNTGFAATPHSFPKSCNYPGRVCPPAAPIVSPWTWAGYDPSAGGPYSSQAQAQAQAAYESYYLTPDRCSVTSSWAPSSWPTGPQYTDGIETAYYMGDTMTVVYDHTYYNCTLSSIARLGSSSRNTEPAEQPY
jgi:hypothetical protein